MSTYSTSMMFRRYTRNASEKKVWECLFVDDGALLATSREGAEKAVQNSRRYARVLD